MSIDLIFAIFVLIFGLIILIRGAGILIDASSSLANSFGISKLVIGLTIIALGTSVPELVVSIFSSLQNNSEIILGNIIGSNIANILLILGISAIVYGGLTLNTHTVKKEIPLLLIITTAFVVSASDLLIDNSTSIITRSESIIFILFFIIYLQYVYELAKDSRADLDVSFEREKRYKSVFKIVFGCIALFVGGKLVVDYIIIISNLIGLNNYAISAVVVAIGTSLPELTVSIVGAIKKESDLIVGNIIGSNIFNTLFIISTSSLIHPITVIAHNFDLFFLLGITTLLLFYITTSNLKLKKWHGYSFLVLYIFYIAMTLTG